MEHNMCAKKMTMLTSPQSRLAIVIRSILNPLTLSARIAGLSLLPAVAFAVPYRRQYYWWGRCH